MALSLQCSCGAKLEIDDTFAGKTITCPDCQKQLSTAPEPIAAECTSGFAIASLFLALALGFTLIGGALAIAFGLFSLSQIALNPHKYGGRKLAWAGILCGAIFSLLSVASYLSPEVLGLDGFFREIEAARNVKYPEELKVVREAREGDFTFSITRPSASWGVLSRVSSTASDQDDVMFMQAWNDAYATCTTEKLGAEDKMEDLALERLLKSELINMFPQRKAEKAGKSKQKTETPRAQVRGKKDLQGPTGAAIVEMVVDFNLTVPPRTFLVRAIKINEFKLAIVAAGTRRSRFERLEPDLRTIVESYQLEKQ